MTRGFATASLAIALAGALTITLTSVAAASPARGASAAAETPIQLISGAGRPAAQPVTHCTVTQGAMKPGSAPQVGRSEVECLVSAPGRTARGDTVGLRVLIQAQAPAAVCAHATTAQDVTLPGARLPAPGHHPLVVHDWTRAPCTP